ncbi:MAG: hypothetical protein RQ758_09235 [Methanomicrobiaceae archaeon]|nr:hypothetical protein [Methanomicrobiaceae archaeon]
MIEEPTTLIQPMLAIITLILGGALIIFIYDAYRVVRQPSLLEFTVGLFILVIAIVFPDVIGILAADSALSYWGTVISRIGEILGIGVMIYAVLR